MNRILAGTAMVVLVLTTGACGHKPTGQVVAVVNGDEVTLQEVNAEIGAAVPDGANKAMVQATALNRIVERRLLAQAAKSDGLDKSSEYLIRRRQLDDALLAQLLNDKVMQSIQVPSTAAAAKFMTEHSWMFADRKLYAIDRIQMLRPSDASVLRALQPLHTIDEVAQKLTELHIQFARGASQIDTARIDKPQLDAIEKLPPGEPFAIQDSNTVNVSSITGVRPAPLIGDEANPIAVQGLRKEALQKALTDRLTALRTGAKIDYQPGFAPPATLAVGPLSKN